MEMMTILTVMFFDPWSNWLRMSVPILSSALTFVTLQKEPKEDDKDGRDFENDDDY